MITQSIYMVLNMIILPLSGLISFEELLILFQAKADLADLIGTLAGNTGNMASFFVTYLM